MERLQTSPIQREWDLTVISSTKRRMSEQSSQPQQREDRRAKLLAIHRKLSLSATTTTTGQPHPERGSAEGGGWGFPPTGTNSRNSFTRPASLEHDLVSSLPRNPPRRRKELSSNTGCTPMSLKLLVHQESSNVCSTNKKRQKLEKLNRLRQKRIALAAQLEELRMSVHHFQGDTLRSELMKKSTLAAEKTKKTSPNHPIDTTSTATVSSRKLLLPLQLRQMRQRPCLAAAYRLSGISVHRLSPNFWAIRLDVLSACYRCFFDVITLEKHGTDIDSRTKNKITKELGVGAIHSNGMQTFLRLVHVSFYALPTSLPLS